MIVEIKDTQFPDICGFHLYDATLVRTLMKAKTDSLDNSNFTETDFKYNQGIIEFNSPNILNEFYQEDSSLINESSESIRKYLVTLFPTCTFEESPVPTNIDYFSTSTSIDGEETYCINIEEKETIKKMVGFYYSNNEEEVVEKEAIEITFTGEELEFSKIVVLVISFEKEERVINLSYTAYQGDKTPYRKMPSYVLRNDSLVKNWKGLEEKHDYLYSSISGSLVGTEKIENRPIYNLLKDYSRGEGWNSLKRYTVGDSVKVGNYTYESVEPDNIGNNPMYSRFWVKTIEE